MARVMSPERELEFAELSAFVNFWCARIIVSNAPQETNAAKPPNLADVLLDIVQRCGRSKALEGLRQAANDALEDLRDRSADDIAAIDSLLREEGIVTVVELRRRYDSSFKRITKRRLIHTETEYHLVNGSLLT